jgi:hypothetical protein
MFSVARTELYPLVTNLKVFFFGVVLALYGKESQHTQKSSMRLLTDAENIDGKWNNLKFSHPFVFIYCVQLSVHYAMKTCGEWMYGFTFS